MPIPFNTTTVVINRSLTDIAADPYDSAPAETVIATSIRAVVSTPTADARLSGGDRVVYTSRLTCDPCDLQVADRITDVATGNIWTALWVQPVTQFGLSHMLAGLRLVTGAV